MPRNLLAAGRVLLLLHLLRDDGCKVSSPLLWGGAGAWAGGTRAGGGGLLRNLFRLCQLRLVQLLKIAGLLLQSPGPLLLALRPHITGQQEGERRGRRLCRRRVAAVVLGGRYGDQLGGAGVSRIFLQGEWHPFRKELVGAEAISRICVGLRACGPSLRRLL